MKITICPPEPPFTRGYEIIMNDTQKRLKNSHNSMFQYDFDDAEVLYLIGEKNYSKFENNEKWEFDIPVWKLNVVSDNGVPKNREQLIYSTNWQEKNY